MNPTPKTELLRAIAHLDPQIALLPTTEPHTKAPINHLIATLEPQTPIPNPLHPSQRSHLLGTWQLIYASQGTVVTRRMTAPQYPVTIRRIWQTLTLTAAQTLAADNGAHLQLPLVGTWQLRAEGTWQPTPDDRTAQVQFHTLGLQSPPLLPGLDRPHWPELRLPLGLFPSRSALWITSYLDEDLRLGRGTTGNLFVFQKQTP